MTTTQERSLEGLMQAALPEGGFFAPVSDNYYMEVTDRSAGLVWMSSMPVTAQQYEELEVEAPLTKTLFARGSMDAYSFLHSPGTPDEPMRHREVAGLRFINVAAMGKVTPPSDPRGPLEAMVEKAHTLGFEAGRTLSILSLPDGDYVGTLGEPDADDNIVLPDGGALKKVSLTSPLIVELPNPTRCFFWGLSGGDLRSFQGPVTIKPV
jgi:hypothetical protein